MLPKSIFITQMPRNLEDWSACVKIKIVFVFWLQHYKVSLIFSRINWKVNKNNSRRCKTLSSARYKDNKTSYESIPQYSSTATAIIMIRATRGIESVNVQLQRNAFKYAFEQNITPKLRPFSLPHFVPYEWSIHFFALNWIHLLSCVSFIRKDIC